MIEAQPVWAKPGARPSAWIRARSARIQSSVRPGPSELLRELEPDHARPVHVAVHRLRRTDGGAAFGVTVVLGQPIEHVVDEQLDPDPVLLAADARIDQRKRRLLPERFALRGAQVRPYRSLVDHGALNVRLPVGRPRKLVPGGEI